MTRKEGVTARRASSWIDEFERDLRGYGLDIVHPFDVACSESIARATGKTLPDLGREHALGLLIGNTRALWAPFNAALEAWPKLKHEPHPLDRYVECVVQRALSKLPFEHQLVWVHHAPPYPFQRLAELSGLATLAPCFHNAHPRYGLWFSLRAALIVDVTYDGPVPEPAREPCASCEKPCLGLLAVAQRAALEEASDSSWQAWLAVRQSCPIGNGTRFGHNQTLYHYTKNRLYLRRD